MMLGLMIITYAPIQTRNLGVKMVQTKTVAMTDEMEKMGKIALKVQMGEQSRNFWSKWS